MPSLAPGDAPVGSAAGLRSTGTSSTMVVGDRVAGNNTMQASAPARGVTYRDDALMVTPAVRTHASNGIRIVPNPNNGTFAIQGSFGTLAGDEVIVEIRTMAGQLVYKNAIMPKNGTINEQVQLNNNLANGMYTLSVKNNAEQKVSHFVLER